MMDYHRSRDQFEEDRIDEVLELIWILREEGESHIEDVRKRSEDPNVSQVLYIVESEGLVSTDNGRIPSISRGKNVQKMLSGGTGLQNGCCLRSLR